MKHPFKHLKINDECRAKIVVLRHDNTRGEFAFIMTPDKFDIIKAYNTFDIDIELLKNLGYDIVWKSATSKEYLTQEIVQSQGGVFGYDEGGTIILDEHVDALIEDLFYKDVE